MTSEQKLHNFSNAKTILITGAAGFIGSWLVREFCDDYNVLVMVRPNSQNLDRLQEVQHKIHVIQHDISQPWPKLPNVDIVLHAGGDASSESCIRDPFGAIDSNIVSTLHALEFSRQNAVEHFVYYSTGEVFGSVSSGVSSAENDAYACTSPYAATKAAGAELVRSYQHCHGIRSSVIHINNTFGPWSQSNRFPVMVIRSVLNRKSVTIHQDSHGNIASRRWFHAADVASHTRWIIDHQVHPFEKWNSAGSKTINNLEFAQLVAATANCELMCQLQVSQRPGHTACYDIDPVKLYKSGWVEKFNINQRITQTLDWYQKNSQWLDRI